MEKTDIKISVIVPVYNAEKFIEKAIDSVVSQKMPGWELLLIDNGSEDGSLDICRRYEREYSSVHVYIETESGAGAARNTGMNIAAGEYIAFLDADDYLADDEVLGKLADRMEETQADIVVCNYERLWNDRLLPAAKHTAFSIEDRDSMDFRFKGFFSVGTLSYVWSRLYRKSFLAEQGIRFENLTYAEDKLFNIECYMRHAEYAFIEDTGYVYRRNTDSISYRYKPDSRECWLDIARRVNDMDDRAADTVKSDDDREGQGDKQITGRKMGEKYRDIVRYIIFFASFFDAKMEYVEYDRSLRAVRSMLKAYMENDLASECFRELACGRQVRELTQGMWRVMIRGFSIGMNWHMYGFLALGIKLLIDLRVDERLSDTGIRE